MATVSDRHLLPVAGNQVKSHGIVHPSAPHALVNGLRLASGATTLVETGTGGGGTAAWAAGLFDQVITIEIDPELHRRSITELSSTPNIELHHGASEKLLRNIVPRLDRPTIF